MLIDRSTSEIKERLMLLMFSRVVFTSLLLGSTIIVQLGQTSSPLARPLVDLYGLIAGIFVLSCVYIFFLNRVDDAYRFAAIQATLDTVIVTLILFVTGGGFASIFPFLYLVVIIYSSILLSRRGVLIIAAFCAIQYGVLIDLEFYRVIEPSVMEGVPMAYSYSWIQVIYKMLITGIACIAVAILSGFLAEQTLRTQRELKALESHVKRVEKLASMGEIAAGMAHEIKNPLASLAGSIQLLRDLIPYDAHHDKLMQIVLRETDRLSELVSNFLLFARPPAGKMETVKLDHAVSEIIDLFQRDRSMSGRIQLTTDLEKQIWIRIDPVHLRQVLWNLLLNASEAISSTGHIHVRIREERHRHAVLEISDDGDGMTADVLKSIFNPFFTTKPKGTGLGLSMVHSILESYDSRIDVDSVVGAGTTFTVIFNRVTPREK